MQIEWKKRLARLTSDILNPFLVGLVMIVVLSFRETSSSIDGIKWSLIMVTLSLLPVFLVIVYLVHNQKLGGISIKARRERNGIYLLASACAIVGSVVVYYLGAPSVLVAMFVTGLSATVIFMCINFLWKISVHTAFVAASATILIVLYGFTGVVSATLLPVIAWARIELEHHSLAQTVTGALLAGLIVVVVFYFFGLVGHITPA